jgi:hypothetical protein
MIDICPALKLTELCSIHSNKNICNIAILVYSELRGTVGILFFLIFSMLGLPIYLTAEYAT